MGTDRLNGFSGFDIVTLIAGSHIFDLEYATSSAVRAARIQNTHLEIFRVS